MRPSYHTVTYRRTAIQFLAALFCTLLTVSSTWAVFVRQNGNAFTLKSERVTGQGYTPMANAQITVSLGNESHDITTDQNGNFCIKNKKDETEEDRRRGNCAFFTGSGKGRIAAKDGSFDMGFTLKPDGSVSVSPSQLFSNVELAGMGLGTVGLIALASSSSGDNPPSGGGTGGGGSTPTTGFGICLGMFTMTFGLAQSLGGCPNVIGNSRMCNFTSLGGNTKRLDCGPNTGPVTGELSPATNGIYNATGTGQYSGASNAPFHVTGQFTVDGADCSFQGVMEVGPPLVNANEACIFDLIGARYAGP